MPVLSDDTMTVTAGGSVPVYVLINDQVPSGSTVTVTSNDGAGTVTVSGLGRIVYAAPETEVGTVTITYRVTDADGDIATAVLLIYVTAINYCNDRIIDSTPKERFTDHGDGTVTDKTTGLMWSKCSVGQSGSDCKSGTASKMNWKSALDASVDSGAHGYNDWRLPNIKELLSIVEFKCVDPSINLAVFPNTPLDDYWSSSPYPNRYDYAWLVFFDGGQVDAGPKNTSSYVRLVRSSGQ